MAPERLSKIASPSGLCFEINGDSESTSHARAILGMEGKSDDECHPISTSNVQLLTSVPLGWAVNVWVLALITRVSLHANTRPQQVSSWCQSNAWHIDKEYLWWHLWNTRVYRNCAQQLANDKSFATNRFPLDYGTSLQPERTNIEKTAQKICRIDIV